MVGEQAHGEGHLRASLGAVAAQAVVRNPEVAFDGSEVRFRLANAAGERVAEHQPGRAFLAGDLVVDLDTVELRFHAASVIRGIIISSALVPPWLPMCRWRGSPGVQSLTV